jgi:hypothetical protein
VRLQVGRVDHQPVRSAGLRGQGREYAIEHAHPGPSYEPVIQGLMRSIDLGRVTPPQPVADDVNDTADNPTIVDTRDAVWQGEIWLDPGELLSAKPKLIRYVQVLLHSLNQRSRRKGILKINGS